MKKLITISILLILIALAGCTVKTGKAIYNAKTLTENPEYAALNSASLTVKLVDACTGVAVGSESSLGFTREMQTIVTCKSGQDQYSINAGSDGEATFNGILVDTAGTTCTINIWETGTNYNPNLPESQSCNYYGKKEIKLLPKDNKELTIELSRKQYYKVFGQSESNPNCKNSKQACIDICVLDTNPCTTGKYKEIEKACNAPTQFTFSAIGYKSKEIIIPQDTEYACGKEKYVTLGAE